MLWWFQQCQVQVQQLSSLKCPILWPSSQTGNKGSSYFKYVEVQDEPVTKKQYEQAREKWQKEKAESNKKAQQDLEKHVK